MKHNKTVFQVENFLTKNEIKSEDDWRSINAFCLAEFALKLYYTKPNYSEKGVEFRYFIEWLENGFGIGDVVEKDDSIYLLGTCGLNKARIAASITKDWGIIQEDIESSLESFKIASNETILKFNDTLRSTGMQLDYSTGTLVNRYKPNPWECVIIEYKAEKYIAIVRKVTHEGRVILCCYYSPYSRDTYFQMKNDFCDINECTFFQADLNDKAILNRALQRYDKRWNSKLNRIQPEDYDRRIGKPYWYVTENFKVKYREPTNAVQSDALRGIAGNCFSCKEDAEGLVEVIEEYLRDVLSDPQK